MGSSVLVGDLALFHFFMDQYGDFLVVEVEALMTSKYGWSWAMRDSSSPM